MRKEEGQGIAYIFVPYWAFDYLGTSESVPKAPRAKMPRHCQLQAHAPRISSGLREMTLVERDGDDDAASQPSEADSLVSQESMAEQQQGIPPTVTMESQNLFEITTKVKWSRQDEINRAKLNPSVSAFLNALCFRKSMLSYLQEPLDDDDLKYKVVVEREGCCNACNNDLGTIPPLEPRSKATDAKP